MAANNPVTKIHVFEEFNLPYTCADGTAISKGILLKLTDSFTAAASDAGKGVIAMCAGIAAMDKEANDGSTQITAWRKGRFDGVASGAIPVGSPIGFVLDNYIQACSALASGACIAGYALETASDNEKINFILDL